MEFFFCLFCPLLEPLRRKNEFDQEFFVSPKKLTRHESQQNAHRFEEEELLRNKEKNGERKYLLKSKSDENERNPFFLLNMIIRMGLLTHKANNVRLKYFSVFFRPLSVRLHF